MLTKTLLGLVLLAGLVITPFALTGSLHSAARPLFLLSHGLPLRGLPLRAGGLSMQNGWRFRLQRRLLHGLLQRLSVVS